MLWIALEGAAVSVIATPHKFASLVNGILIISLMLSIMPQTMMVGNIACKCAVHTCNVACTLGFVFDA